MTGDKISLSAHGLKSWIIKLERWVLRTWSCFVSYVVDRVFDFEPLKSHNLS